MFTEDSAHSAGLGLETRSRQVAMISLSQKVVCRKGFRSGPEAILLTSSLLAKRYLTELRICKWPLLRARVLSHNAPESPP